MTLWVGGQSKASVFDDLGMRLKKNHPSLQIAPLTKVSHIEKITKVYNYFSKPKQTQIQTLDSGDTVQDFLAHRPNTDSQCSS